MRYVIAVSVCAAIWVAHVLVVEMIGAPGNHGGPIPAIILFLVLGGVWYGITKRKKES